MIIRDNIEFHAAELRPIPGCGALALTRIPRKIADSLNERARHVSRDSVDTEIRFVCNAPRIYLYLSAEKPEFWTDKLPVTIFRGDFEQKTEYLEEGRITRVVLDRPDMGRIKPEVLRRGPGIGFSPDVIRIIPDRGVLLYCGIDAFGHEVRPPAPEEKPSKLCLFYGSSITNSIMEGYPAVAARSLGMDFCNIGLSGACQMETALVDWMAEQHWDLAMLELGINVLGMAPEEFRTRAEYTIRKFTETGKTVFLTTIFPCCYAVENGDPSESGKNFVRFNEILRELYGKYRCSGSLHLLEGSEILTDFSGLSTDFVHPRKYGHFLMGRNLAEQMKKIIG